MRDPAPPAPARAGNRHHLGDPCAYGDGLFAAGAANGQALRAK